MSQLPVPVVALVVALITRMAALVPGDVNASSNVVNTGAAFVPVTNTVYVLFAENEGENPVRLVVEPAERTASCGFPLFTPVQALAAPNAILPLPVATVPFSAI